MTHQLEVVVQVIRGDEGEVLQGGLVKLGEVALRLVVQAGHIVHHAADGGVHLQLLSIAQ